MRAARRGTPSALGLAAALLLGCSPRAHADAAATWIVESEDPVVIVIGVVDLRASELAVLPRLQQALQGGTQWTDALSAGAGAAAALALVDGRAPLTHLREPGVEQRAEWDLRVLEVAATLRSEPEWVDARLQGVVIRHARAPLPSLDDLPAGRVCRVLLLDPFSHEVPPLRPRPGDPDGAGRAWLEEDLAGWITAQRAGPLAGRLHVVLTGIPRAPARDQRARALPGGGPVPQALQVPLVWATPHTTVTERSPEPVLVHELLARALGAATTATPWRWSAWWSDHCGGMYVELPATDRWPAARAWIDERGGWTAVEGEALAARQAELDAATLRLGFGSTTPPRLWCALRGSEEIDFVDLHVVADGIDSMLTGWALEDIDIVRTGTPRVSTLALAAEPRGDGALIELPWPPRAIEVRLGDELQDSGVFGASYFAGESSRAVSLGNVRLAPFTRNFWRAASGAWPARADDWWPDAAVGVHLILSTQEAGPEPASWVD